jgi:hypothetical protein
MADLAVAHHAFGQTDGVPAGQDQGVWIFFVQEVIAGLFCEVHGIENVLLGKWVPAPAIANNENYRFARSDHKNLSSITSTAAHAEKGKNPLMPLIGFLDKISSPYNEFGNTTATGRKRFAR